MTMARLSQPIGRLEPHYEVVVIGSGYGGGVAASRMARAGLKTCVLERGREFGLGDFPNRALQGWRELQFNLATRHWGRSAALFELHVNPDVSAVVGCGLGGTSLINAGVALKPDPRLWRDPRWPAAIRNDLRSVAHGYMRARQMLRPRSLPTSFGALRKLSALNESAAALDWSDQYYRPPIDVSFEDGPNRAGVEQRACNACGDCISGCNLGAKNTTAMTYLPDAVNHGAAVFTQVEARSVQQGPRGWIVRLQLNGVGRERFEAAELFVFADRVIIAAGAIGSTAILLRSKDRGLPASDCVGKRFTGNGDVLAFAYNTDREINGVGFGALRRGSVPDVGPCITGIIDHRKATKDPRDGFVIEEGSMPGALGLFLPFVLAGINSIDGRPVGWRDWIKGRLRIAKTFLQGPHHGATRHTQTYLVMAHDNEEGKIELQADRPRIRWPSAGRQPVFEVVDKALDRATRALGGDFVEDPIWAKSFGRNLITVHPLGGCAMGENADAAVVDHMGRVFSGHDGGGVHEGLFVMDGAVVPISLGVNPLLTIAALAERACEGIARSLGVKIDYAFRAQGARLADRVGLRFTERMTGFFTTDLASDFSALEARGRSDRDADAELVVTIDSDDLERMLSDDAHEAEMIGVLTSRALSDQPMSLMRGRFNLFVRSPDSARDRRIAYAGLAHAANGDVFRLEGFKALKAGRAMEVWGETTTLYATLYRLGPGDETMIGRGVLKVGVIDFARELTTLDARCAPSCTQWVLALAKFVSFFARSLFAVYFGGAFRKPVS
jgi:cholesterol oxidase